MKDKCGVFIMCWILLTHFELDRGGSIMGLSLFYLKKKKVYKEVTFCSGLFCW